MSRFVVALFSRSLPRPLPHPWRIVWQAHIARWMNGLIAVFLFVLPWIAVPRWFDGSELPKALLGIGVMGTWLVLRGVYALLRSSLQDGSSRPWSAFSLWIGVLGLVAGTSWAFSAHRAISWLGNQAQIASSLVVVVVALWLVVAVRDGFQRTPQAGRLWLRSWFLGMCVAIVGALISRLGEASSLPKLFQSGNPLDLFLMTPLVFTVGLYLLSTRASVSTFLTVRGVVLYKLSHALLALVLIGALTLGLLVDLQWLWFIVLCTGIAAFTFVSLRRRRVSLAGCLSLLAVIFSLIGLSLFRWPGQTSPVFSAPRWITELRATTKISTLTEILPSQSLSWTIVSGALRESPLFGAGPGDWTYVSERVRPLAFNKTALWAVRFTRSGSALTTFVVEYGLVPSLLAVAFLAVLLWSLVRQKMSEDTLIDTRWLALLLMGALAFAALRPFGVTSVLSLALLVGLAAAGVFGEGKVAIPQVERHTTRQAFVGFAVLLVIGMMASGLRRAVAAELLTSYAPHALSLARRLNPADDVTFAREAAIYLEQARYAGQQQEMVIMQRILDRVDELLVTARTRNPNDAEHASLALQATRLRAEVNPEVEDRVLTLASELDALRPTDPSAPLTVFGVQRARMARETRWVEQGQGREKEEALRRENQAKTAAEESLQEALRRKPDYLPALYAQAAWFAQLGQMDQAIQRLEGLLVQNPQSADIRLPLALLYRRKQEPAKAVTVLQGLVQRIPDQLEYHWQLVLALVEAKRFDEATTILQQLVAQEPQNTRYQSQLRDVLRARAQSIAPPVIVNPATSTPVATSTARTTTPAKPASRARRTTR